MFLILPQGLPNYSIPQTDPGNVYIKKFLTYKDKGMPLFLMFGFQPQYDKCSQFLGDYCCGCHFHSYDPQQGIATCLNLNVKQNNVYYTLPRILSDTSFIPMNCVACSSVKELCSEFTMI